MKNGPSLTEALENAGIFYEAQYKEVKVVANVSASPPLPKGKPCKSKRFREESGIEGLEAPQTQAALQRETGLRFLRFPRDGKESSASKLQGQRGNWGGLGASGGKWDLGYGGTGKRFSLPFS